MKVGLRIRGANTNISPIVKYLIIKLSPVTVLRPFSIEGKRNALQFRCAEHLVGGAARRVALDLQVFRPGSPVDAPEGSGLGRTIADTEAGKAEIIRQSVMQLRIQQCPRGSPVEDAQPEADGGIGNRLAGCIPDHRLVVERMRRLCLQAHGHDHGHKKQKE